jgi:hypothetical protein
MRQIRATPAPDGSFVVEVLDGTTSTSHTVTVPGGLPQALGWPPGRDIELIESSFAFLLEREPATSILRRFSLEVIGEYFPDYGSEMTRRAHEVP